MKFSLPFLLVGTAIAVSHNKIEFRLATSLHKRGSANVLVTMKEQTGAVLDTLEGRNYASRDEQLNTVAHTLMDYASVSQSAARELLDSLNVPYDVFWINNQIYIRGATSEVVHALSAIENVSKISEEFEVKLDPVDIQIVSRPKTPKAGNQWNIDRINAPQAWGAPANCTGKGALVGSVDTGVYYNHTDLKDNYVGTYGWINCMVPRTPGINVTQTPIDDNGHGTHTTGTACGKNGIGVAPDAKWMSCKAFNAEGIGMNADIICCLQFMLCPTLPDGTGKDCTKAPHVINCSWGGGQLDASFNDAIKSLIGGRINVVIANGNSGPNCTTANSPADTTVPNVMSVAATDFNNTVTSYSSKGPTLDGRMDPTCAAPGDNVMSAYLLNMYANMSGTSMATPHVTGVVALAKGCNQSLTVPEIYSLIQTNNIKPVSTGVVCNKVPDTQYPNYSVGSGIVNAAVAIPAPQS